MTKTLTALVAAGTFALAAVATPQQAEARGRGGAVAAGVIGGIALGAIIASSSARSHHYGYGYGRHHGYYGGPAYYRHPQCYWTRQRVYDGYGYWHVRRVRVCH